jgi:hypothetical protein
MTFMKLATTNVHEGKNIVINFIYIFLSAIMCNSTSVCLFGAAFLPDWLIRGVT